MFSFFTRCVALLLMFASLSSVNGSIQCSYCGIRQLCDTKFDPGERYSSSYRLVLLSPPPTLQAQHSGINFIKLRSQFVSFKISIFGILNANFGNLKANLLEFKMLLFWCSKYLFVMRAYVRRLADTLQIPVWYSDAI